MKKLFLILPLLTIGATVAMADDSHHPPKSEVAQTTSAAPSEAMSKGEVRKTDLAAGKITLKHEELQTLDMPAMTMVFRVGDTAMLENLKPGDKVRFRAERVDGALTVTAIKPVRQE